MRTLRNLIALLALPISGVFPGISPAAEYPERPIRLVVPYAPGGNADIMGRTVAQPLGQNLGQQVVIDNRPGANSIIGTELVARAVADGYTILIVASSHATNPSMVKQLPYDTVRDLAPVSLVGSTPLILVAHPALPVASLKEFLAFARSRPGQLNFGSSGNGSPANLAGALLDIMGGIRLVHVPYRGTAQATTDVMAGHVQLAFPSMTSVLPHVRTGKLRALGITALKRSPLAPELQTVSEAGVTGYQASIWNGILAPAATPKSIVAKLNGEIVRVLNSSETRERFAGIGADIGGGSPEEFKAFIESEMKKWSRIIRESEIRVDLER
jgi:tripartite-type tricarboxylate transporter receptor subunit TctC